MKDHGEVALNKLSIYEEEFQYESHFFHISFGTIFLSLLLLSLSGLPEESPEPHLSTEMKPSAILWSKKSSLKGRLPLQLRIGGFCFFLIEFLLSPFHNL